MGRPSHRLLVASSYFLDCELYQKHSSHVNSPPSYATLTVHQSLSLLGSQDHTIACDALLANVLYPLSEIIYYFLGDIAGVFTIAQFIARQLLEYAEVETLKPSIVLVVSKPDEEEGARYRVESLVREMTNYAERTHMSIVIPSISTLFLGHSNCGPRATVLRSHLTRLALSKQENLRATRLLFNFDHVEALLAALLDKLVVNPHGRFSFIDASRPFQLCAATRFASCLQDLLHDCPSESWLWHCAAPWSSGAILLQNYPDKAHRELLAARLMC